MIKRDSTNLSIFTNKVQLAADIKEYCDGR